MTKSEGLLDKYENKKCWIKRSFNPDPLKNLEKSDKFCSNLMWCYSGLHQLHSSDYLIHIT